MTTYYLCKKLAEKGKTKDKQNARDNVYISIQQTGHKGNCVSAVAFRFERDIVELITDNRYIQLSYDIEEGRIYFEKASNNGYYVSISGSSLPVVRTTTINPKDFPWFEEHQGSFVLQKVKGEELYYIDVFQHRKERRNNYQRQRYQNNKRKNGK